ncbi:MAG TPA: maleylpyruvate isomerase family mycothiol-dependent enzyme [Acidimicrobiales bacterium]|nr:maleylpyruvate isomerase family mycothiol-dependent enzyme [Acidimicrobiales bacterium]
MEPWDAVRDERLDLVERLAELDDEQWNSPSLCELWRIRDVLAHLTAGAEGAFGVGAIFKGLLRHRFNHHRWVAADGQLRGQQDPEDILKALRNAAANRRVLPGARPGTVLADVLIHGQDICRPLGIRRDLPRAHLVAVADFIKDDRHIYGAKKRIAGVKLTATDMDWTHGHGPEVTGRAEALVMMMAGRWVALDDLSGEGKASLAARR